jgi:GMP synthase (glutamine-hydrolysing)
MRILAIVHQRDAGPGVFAEAIRGGGHALEVWMPAEEPEPPAEPPAYGGVLSLGGAMHPDQHQRHPWLATEGDLLRDGLARGVPMLGVCLGAQLLAGAAGGQALRAAHPEIGWHRVELTPEGRADPLLGPLTPGFEAFQWHSYRFSPPAGAVVLAESEVGPQACRIGEVAWAIQFHAEVDAGDAARWIDDYRSDEDAVRIGVDPIALRGETEVRIGEFNRLGRDLCRRWLEVAERRHEEPSYSI